jgi:tripartite-type tricarboxylate transporter receptor subunit TctC
MACDRSISWVLATALALGAPATVLAQGDFYRGKQVRLVSGHPVGGDYDVGARFLAKHLSRHIPGQPVIVVQNMPAAARVAAAHII